MRSQRFRRRGQRRDRDRRVRPQRERSGQRRRARKEMQVVGCLQQCDGGRSYVLRTIGERSPDGVPNNRLYRVVADKENDLASNTGARVAITGHVVTVPVHAGETAVGTSGANTKPQQDRPDLIDMDVVRATSITKIGERCEVSGSRQQ